MSCSFAHCWHPRRLARILTWLQMFALSLVLVITQTLSMLAHAQDLPASNDIEPPTIELEETKSGIAGEAQVFSAFVVDNVGLKDVKLYYRYAGQQPFKTLPMVPLSDTGYFTATVPTAGSEERELEYYIQARDQNGNRVVRGYAFDPLVRTLSSSLASIEPEPPTNTGSEAQEESGGFKWWYVALGVLAAGAIAGIASSGDDGSGNNGNTGVPVTLTVNPPTN